MKKILFALLIISLAVNFATLSVHSEIKEPIVKVEIPTVSDTESTYKEKPSKTDEFVDATKEVKDKTVEATKDLTDKTKKGTKKAVEATKQGTKKAVEATKDFADKTVDNTKEFFEGINPNKPVTLDNLTKEAQINKLKTERNQLKSAYNSRIKDIKAKIKLTEKSLTLTEVQKQNRIYNLNKEKKQLEIARDNYVAKYNAKIKEVKAAE